MPRSRGREREIKIFSDNNLSINNHDGEFI